MSDLVPAGVIETIVGAKRPPMQPRARAFMHAHPADPFIGWRYITWIGHQWRTWAAESGVPYGDKPMTDVHHAAFDAWLAERYPDNETTDAERGAEA